VNVSKLILGGVVVVVVSAIVVGLWISGSPAEQRMLRADDLRISDLQRLSRSIQDFFDSTESLPSDLDVLLNGWASDEIPRDPETDQFYTYEIVDERRFRLCAEFALDSRPNRQPDFWSHGSGNQCFAFDYSDVVFD